MQQIDTEILVIGGGATGCGVLHDLAQRGFACTLVERGDLGEGTTGRYHGLLHSGARYAVKDPQAARECSEENRILRRIMPFCLEDTGGFFVLTQWDDPDFVPAFLQGCQVAGIPVEELDTGVMLRHEPALNPQISRCFRVTDAAADSFLAADANAEAARQRGARVLKYHPVERLVLNGSRLCGAVCRDLARDHLVQINADLVVNASGAWAGQIAALAGAAVKIIPGKGSMLAASYRVVNTVINRCKMPSDGDLLVPIHTVAVMGTTDIPVPDPDHFAIEPWEVELMLAEGEKIVPGFRSLRFLRAWAGVRPLYVETPEASEGDRELSRAYVLLDHASRDGVEGLLTITSGKWTTYRRMAETTVDLVCRKLGTARPCRTAEEMLPNPSGAQRGYHHLGAPLAGVEQAQDYGNLICECELATREDVVAAIVNHNPLTIDDVRRDVRLGMGPCQGGFCTYRIAGLLHQLRRAKSEDTNLALRDFLAERWRGLLPVLWGRQLRQERLDQLIYLSLLNVDHLPGPTHSTLTRELYSLPEGSPEESGDLFKGGDAQAQSSDRDRQATAVGAGVDLLVVGAGLAGLSAAFSAARHGLRVRVISAGWGTLNWHTGCIDVLGYLPGRSEPVASPLAALPELMRAHPRHPYALTGSEGLSQALDALKELCASHRYPLEGSLERNLLLPSALGAARPTCLAPLTMAAGDLGSHEKMLLVGFMPLNDFYPHLAADNLEAQGFPAAALVLDLKSLRKRRFVTGRVLAELFEQPEFTEEVLLAIRQQLPAGIQKIGLPAVLGLQGAPQVVERLALGLGMPVFEIPILPASIPGIRLQRILVSAIEKLGGRVYEGMPAVEVTASAGQVELVWSEAAARRKPHRAKSYLLATGGLLGGGIVAEYSGELRETATNLPVYGPGLNLHGDRRSWLGENFLDPGGQPLFRCGLEIDARFHPLGAEGNALYSNLYAAGTLLSEADFMQERSLEGIALATGFMAGLQVAGDAGQ